MAPVWAQGWCFGCRGSMHRDHLASPLLQVNYTQPLVAVKFLNVTPNVEVNVECRINAANIATDDERDKFAGRVAFKLRINKT